MAAASWVMADPRRYAAAQRAGRSGRALSRGGRIRALPPPLSAWTRGPRRARSPGQDVPAMVARVRPGPVVTPRDEVLARIRAALGGDGAAAPEAPPAAYRTSGDLHGEPLLDLLAERLAHYRASVRRSSPAGLGAAIAAALAERGARRVVVPEGLDLPPLPGVDTVIDHGLSPQDLDALDGVITGGVGRDRADRHDRPRRVARPGTARDHPGSRLPPVRRARRAGGRTGSRGGRPPRTQRPPPAHLDQRPVGNQRHRTFPGRGRARSPHARGHSGREPVTRRPLRPWLTPGPWCGRPEQHGLEVAATVRGGVGVMVEHVLQVLARRLHALDLRMQ